MMSSIRLRNSGRNAARKADWTSALADSEISPSGLIPSRMASEPRFEVMMMTVFLKSTV